MSRCIPPIDGGIRDDGTPQVQAGFKAQVAFEVLRGDKANREVASRHKVHSNRVSPWERQAMDGPGAVFSNGTAHVRQDHQSEVHDLHAKIGALTVERDFLAGGLARGLAGGLKR